MDCNTPGFPVHHQLPELGLHSSCPLSRWCHPTISSSVVPFSSCLQSFPASGSVPTSQFFASDSQNIGASASASVLPIQDWFPLGLTGLIFLQSKELSRVISNTTVQITNTTAPIAHWVGHFNLEMYILPFCDVFSFHLNNISYLSSFLFPIF